MCGIADQNDGAPAPRQRQMNFFNRGVEHLIGVFYFVEQGSGRSLERCELAAHLVRPGLARIVWLAGFCGGAKNIQLVTADRHDAEPRANAHHHDLGIDAGGLGVRRAPYAEAGVGRLDWAKQMRANLRANAVGSHQHIAGQRRAVRQRDRDRPGGVCVVDGNNRDAEANGNAELLHCGCQHAMQFQPADADDGGYALTDAGIDRVGDRLAGSG